MCEIKKDTCEFQNVINFTLKFVLFYLLIYFIYKKYLNKIINYNFYQK